MRPIVAPPEILRQRAWECAFCLRDEFADRLVLEHRVNVEVVYRAGPDGLGWRDIAAMLVLYGHAVEVRV